MSCPTRCDGWTCTRGNCSCRRRWTRASRTFAAAFQVAQIEARGEIEALAKGAALADRAADRLFRRHLGKLFRRRADDALCPLPARLRSDRVRPGIVAAAVRRGLGAGRAPADHAAAGRRAGTAVLHGADRPRGAGFEAIRRGQCRAARRCAGAVPAVAVASRFRPAGELGGAIGRAGGRQSLADASRGR